MLKRKDLVDQFSLVVKQEIKNYQDASLAMNLAINSLHEQMSEMSALFSNRMNGIDSDLNYFKIKVSQLKKDFELEKGFIKKLENDFVAHEKKNFVFNSGWLNELDEIKTSLKEVYERLEILNELDMQKAENIHELFGTLKQQCYQLENKIKEASNRVKKEILELPSDIETVREELETDLNSHKVDVEGVGKEIAILKKTQYILKKELEHVNTRIDRLKQ